MKLRNIFNRAKDPLKDKKRQADPTLHPTPYNGTNNRKKTRGRMEADALYQSVPMYELNKEGKRVKLLGYRYIKH